LENITKEFINKINSFKKEIILKSIKSISDISDTCCLAEIKCTSKFENICKLSAYAVLNLSVKKF
jgi:hypothetical protein